MKAKHMRISITLENDPLNGKFTSTPKLTAEQAAQLGITADDIQAGEKRCALETRGPWHIPVSYRAIAHHQNFPEIGSREDVTHTFWPARKLSHIRQGGYELEGRVSIEGKSYSAFTSSSLVEIDGTLVSLATIFPRINS